MYMAVDMILAETMVSHAAGTVAELQLRVIGVRPSANGAFIDIGEGFRIPLRLPC